MTFKRSAHYPAALLLAQMRVKEAYPRLVKIINFKETVIEDLWDDFVIEEFTTILRDTFNGDAFLLPELMENRRVSPWSRAAAVTAWGMHYFDKHISREEICGCFRRLIETYKDINDDDRIVLSNMANCVREQKLEEMADDIIKLYESEALFEDLCDDAATFTENLHDPDYVAEDNHLDDAIGILETMYWFDNDLNEPDEDDYDDYEESKRKIGRNEPCPCGSGKKYKNCCLNKN